MEVAFQHNSQCINKHRDIFELSHSFALTIDSEVVVILVRFVYQRIQPLLKTLNIIRRVHD